MTKKSDIYYAPENSPVVPDKFDVRIRLRSLTRGLISHEDVKKYRENLPDDALNADFRPFTEVIGRDAAGDVSSNGQH